MKKTFAILLTTTLLTTGCATWHYQLKSYCDQNPVICTLALVTIAGGIALAATSGQNQNHHHVYVSDDRLKRDIQYLKTLDNGLRIYAFRYDGDDRFFAGVIAQDLVDNPKFANAVQTGPDGYLRVDYGKLGYGIFNAGAIRSASKKALERAS
jgi:hypothetical protein